MTFVPSEGKIHVQTYSPYLDQYEMDGNSDFIVDYETGLTDAQLADPPDSSPPLPFPQAMTGACFGIIVGFTCMNTGANMLKRSI